MNARSIAAIAALALAPAAIHAQEPARDLAGDVDTVTGRVDAAAEKLAELETTVKGLTKLKFSGYVQGRFTDGEKAVFHTRSDLDKEGFYVRRGRLKAVYDAGDAQAVIQLDATGSGVSLKEAYAQLKLPWELTLQAGQLPLPFGYEVGVVSSAHLDLLERSSVVRKLLAGEYDRGVALAWSRGPLSAKAGLYNGNGVEGGANDNDNLKDVIGRVAYDLGVVNVGLSGWYGTLRVYNTVGTLEAGDYDRTRLGLDVQAYLDLLPVGGTAIKAEYLQGKTILGKTATDADLVKLKAGIPQMGWYALVSQTLGKRDAVAVRYDYYDENTDLDDGEAGAKATGTLALAWHHWFGGNLKASVLYEIPTQVKGPDGFEDPDDDALTFQLQASF